MIIRKMTACFGALENESLELEPGLNIICAPNESGKSTWCAFIRAMLYGINSSQREKNGVKPDKLRYAPWSGAPMSGEIELEHDGRSITLSRRSKTPAAPMRDFSAVYTGTAEPVPGLAGKDAGFTLTGMPREVFDRSVFVTQGGLGVDNHAELEKRIAAMVSTGEEGASFTQADERLRAWQRKRRFRQSGRIPELETRAQELERRIESMRGAVNERDELVRLLALAHERQSECERAQRSELESGGLELLQRVSERREALRQATDRAADVRETLRRRAEELDGSVFSGKTAQEAADEAQSARKAFYSAQALPRRSCPFAAAALALCVILAVLAALSVLPWIPCAAGGALLFTAGAALVISARRKSARRTGEILSHYAVSSPEEIEPLARAYAAALTALDTAQRARFGAEREVERREQELRESEGELVRRQDEAGRTGGALRQAQDEAAALERRLAEVRGRFAELGDPLVLKTELSSLNSRIDELRGQYDALELAIGTLRQANEELSLRFAPELSRAAGEIFCGLTGQRYDRVLFDRELSARVRLSGESVDRGADFLSAGTLDQLYLSLRLAVCRLALPEGSSCPLILDDALVNFDDERMERAVRVLTQIARERQVILLTCHDREVKVLERLRGVRHES